MAKAKKRAPVLSTKLLCPFSRRRIGKIVFKEHTMSVRKASNGGLHTFCYAHGVRVFINHPEMVPYILNHSEVIRG